MRPEFSTCFPLRAKGVHEAQGPGALAFAAAACAAMAGPVLWVRERWRADQLNPQGLLSFVDPDRLLVALGKDQAECLGVAEETLRDGAIPMVVIECTRGLEMLEGRRLLLAAKTGRTTGLCLVPEGTGCNAAETRWHVAGRFDPRPDTQAAQTSLMQWDLVRNKSGTLGAWQVLWDHHARRIRRAVPIAANPEK